MRSRLPIVSGPLAATWGGWQAARAQPRPQKRPRTVLRSNWHHLGFWPCSRALAGAGKSRLATAFCADPTRGAANGAKLWKTSHKAPPATLRPSRNGPRRGWARSWRTVVHCEGPVARRTGVASSVSQGLDAERVLRTSLIGLVLTCRSHAQQ